MDITPTFIYEYESDSEEYTSENQTVHDFEAGFEGRFSKGQLNILACMGYHLIDGPLKRQSKFTRNQGLNYVSNDPGLESNQQNYYVSD